MLILGIVIGLLAGGTLAAPVVYHLLRRQTERVIRAERTARRTQRLADIGAMTSGLAHEIKNPLSTIGLNAQLLGEAVEDLPIEEEDAARLTRRVGTLRREVERLRDILSDFLQFAGEIRLDRHEVDLNLVLEEMIDFYLPQAEHHGIKLRADFTPTPARALVDRKQIQQAVLNLLINATQAMEQTEGGTVPGRLREIYLRTRPAVTDEGRAWEIHVIDTGPGIPDDARDAVFTPYFTTKAAGSGLGLPTTKRIIEAHGGHIDVHSAAGQGTDFVIILPRGD
ncbi:MAG: hypothetical protein KDA21_14160 [Phycisphaerales bacterium]|nr:hypothetical protein [Phycisphaerales bacterium]